jgi:tetratricopeptide (TPR) repeat protein
MHLGLCYIREKEFEKATAWFTKALKNKNLLDKEKYRVYKDLSICYKNLASLDKENYKTLLNKAIKHLTQVIEIINRLPEEKLSIYYEEKLSIYHELGICYTSIGNSKEANKCFENAIYQLKKKLDNKKLEPEKKLKTHNDLGMLYKKLGQLNEAIKHFSEAVKIDIPANQSKAIAYYNKGLCDYESNKYNDGINSFKEALKCKGIDDKIINPTTYYIAQCKYKEYSQKYRKIEKSYLDKALNNYAKKIKDISIASSMEDYPDFKDFIPQPLEEIKPIGYS